MTLIEACDEAGDGTAQGGRDRPPPGLMMQRTPRFNEPHAPSLAMSSTMDNESHDQWRGHLAFVLKLLSASQEFVHSDQ